jgi:hypothetical protein
VAAAGIVVVVVRAQYESPLARLDGLLLLLLLLLLPRWLRLRLLARLLWRCGCWQGPRWL